ncbi:hypothetical protein AMS68_003416 [Peltaster fructicola]|uniref:HIG1 domain-containing protein n=1 Tax=Peltaster fructicola TaxID=286661 RepID=A0A6H0XTF6_9PEZI|nr:hypothetical protein AMS68_003416 [Peltaster fructicola]
MSVPGNINPAPPPSSFDDDPDFFEESRMTKLKRRVFEEPLIPLGCALTVWALIEATKSIRAGDKVRTNQMFRRRVYAQGFTLLAFVAGSFYWEGDRAKRRQYDELSEEKRKQERREAWLRELEARDQEEDELRKIRDKVTKERIDASNKAKSTASQVRSVLEAGESRSDRSILSAAMALWRQQ